MIKNSFDWIKFALDNPLNIGSYYEELQRVFKKEVSECMEFDDDASDVQED